MYFAKEKVLFYLYCVKFAQGDLAFSFMFKSPYYAECLEYENNATVRCNISGQLSLNVLREDVSIHWTNLKYCGKSLKIRFLSYFHSL